MATKRSVGSEAGGAERALHSDASLIIGGLGVVALVVLAILGARRATRDRDTSPEPEDNQPRARVVAFASPLGPRFKDDEQWLAMYLRRVGVDPNAKRKVREPKVDDDAERARQKREEAKPESEVEVESLEPTEDVLIEDTPTVAVDIGVPPDPWHVRFDRLVKVYQRAAGGGRDGVVSDMGAILDETLPRAEQSFPFCREAITYYEQHKRVFKAHELIATKLRAHQVVYFRMAFARATGPGTLAALRKWCHTWGFADEETKVAALLKQLQAATGDQASREQARTRREQVDDEITTFLEKRVDMTARALGEVLDWMTTERFAPDAPKAEVAMLIAQAIEDEEVGRRLAATLAAVRHEAREAAPESKLASALALRVEKLKTKLSDKILKAVTQCLAASEPGKAFDLFQYLLRFDPQNARAHKGLGHVKVEGRWLRRYEAERFQEGYEWDDRFAWVLRKDKKRYEEGSYFAGGGWKPIADLNREHAAPETPWELRSEHFLLVTTADLELSARVVKRLEAVFLQAFRQYDLFFSGKGTDRVAELIFGVAPNQKPLKVYFYRSVEQFKQYGKPPTDWAAGFYDPSRGASFFYADGPGFAASTLQHELIHQILGEFSGGGNCPSWLAEGAAVYLEEAFFDRDGQLTLGGFADHGRMRTYQGNVRSGVDEHSFSEMIKFVTGAQWDSGDISQNYRGAGAVVYFLMHFDGGRYRGDFLDMLRDAYQGGMRPIDRYFGVSEASLDFLMTRFYKDMTLE